MSTSTPIPPGGSGAQAEEENTEVEVVPSFKAVMGVQVVDINVGRGNVKIHFRVHKTLLCAKVLYFEKMFKSGFKEATDNKVSMPEDDPKAFDLLMLWVYTGNLPPFEWVLKPPTNLGNFDALTLYALADKMCLENVMDLIATSYIEAFRVQGALPRAEYLGSLYTKLPEHTALRKYASYSLHYILHGPPQTPENVKIWPADKLNDTMAKHPTLTLEYVQLVQKLPHGQAVPDPRLLPPRTFHQHAADALCPVKLTSTG
ncbi:uncharacterized protein PAC_17034 [Phialocephala subalpina]|uniref:BTB domain-containing protein n=1 Tax=Phialocephala subalpina TaxID=576137 RepID=A0A1L7XQ50_9HELO|nr:uncharacterized protein PAC_17034 [Phialocephala subalpina]